MRHRPVGAHPRKLSGAFAVVFAIAIPLTAASCSAADAPDDHELSTEEREQAQARMDEFRQFVSASTSFTAEGEIRTEQEQEQTFDIDFDRENDAFRGEVVSKSGDDRLSIDILRAANLTWVKAPPAYWSAFGYDGAPAEGKYVVFNATEGTSIADAYDFNLVLSSIPAAGEGEIRPLAQVERDGVAMYQYELSTREDPAVAEIPVAGAWDIVHIESSNQAVEADVTITGFNEDVTIEAPDPDEVVTGDQ